MKEKECYHYLFLGEKRITEIYVLYELRMRARNKADKLLLALSEYMEKNDGYSKDLKFIVSLHKETEGEPQGELIWKAIHRIGEEFEKEIALHVYT